MAFGIQFEFDAEGEAPNVFIADDDGSGTCYINILEEPILKVQEWSWNDEDWKPGELATAIVNFMNSSAYNQPLEPTNTTEPETKTE